MHMYICVVCGACVACMYVHVVHACMCCMWCMCCMCCMHVCGACGAYMYTCMQLSMYSWIAHMNIHENSKESVQKASQSK